jgi:hypothetical protein
MTEEELKELNNTNRAEEMIILVEGLVVLEVLEVLILEEKEGEERILNLKKCFSTLIRDKSLQKFSLFLIIQTYSK